MVGVGGRANFKYFDIGRFNSLRIRPFRTYLPHRNYPKCRAKVTSFSGPLFARFNRKVPQNGSKSGPPKGSILVEKDKPLTNWRLSCDLGPLRGLMRMIAPAAAPAEAKLLPRSADARRSPRSPAIWSSGSKASTGEPPGEPSAARAELARRAHDKNPASRSQESLFPAALQRFSSQIDRH